MSVLDFDPAALAELTDTAAWYEEQRAGLASEFLAEIDRVVAEISARPTSFAKLEDTAPALDIRRAMLERFPFALVFMELGAGRTRIVAVAHERRQPGYWLRRMPG